MEIAAARIPAPTDRTAEHASIGAIASLTLVTLAALLSATPLTLFPVLAVLAAGLGAIAVLDQKTKTIKNRHTLILAGFVTVGVLGLQAMSWGQPVIILAVAGAAGTFLFMLALHLFAGFAGGGDTKLSPVIGAVLTLLNPMAALIWVTLTLFAAAAGILIQKVRNPELNRIAMAPYMAVALPLTVMAAAALAHSPYLPSLLNLV